MWLIPFVLIAIAILGIFIYYGGYGILWALVKSRLIYPIAWFVFSLVVAAHDEWVLNKILMWSWFSIVWLVIGGILAIMVVVLGIRDIIRFFVADFCWSDIPNYFAKRKSDKEFEREFIEYNSLKRKVYDLYKQLEQEEYYFSKYICKNSKEREEFAIDWKCYIQYLEQKVFISFAEWYERNERWKYTTYNHEYTERYRSFRQENVRYTIEKSSVKENVENDLDNLKVNV